MLFRHARRRRLFRQEWPDIYRWELRASLSPVLMWFLAIPLGMLLNRRRPTDAARYLA